MNTLISLLAANAADYSEKARILGFDQQLIISTVIHAATALTLIFVLGKLLFKPVNKILANRKENIENEFEAIEKDTKTALALKEEYELKIAEINKEAEKILSKARKSALDQESKIISEAREEADRIHTRAALAIEREKSKVKDDIRKEIIEVATLMASKFVSTSMTDQIRDELYEKTLSEIGEDIWLN